MEFTQETIDALQINEVEIMKKVAEELNIRVPQAVSYTHLRAHETVGSVRCV